MAAVKSHDPAPCMTQEASGFASDDESGAAHSALLSSLEHLGFYDNWKCLRASKLASEQVGCTSAHHVERQPNQAA